MASRSASMRTINGLIAEALNGRVEAIEYVASTSQEEMLKVTSDRPLILTRVAVASVLLRYSRGEITKTDAQRWASFVRRGYVANTEAGALRPLEIDWEASHEDAISQAVVRLDELGV